MENPFVEIAENHFGDYLATHGFELVRNDYAPKAFGSAIVEYHSDKYKFRLISERADIFVELGLIGDEEPYHDLQEIIMGINHKYEWRLVPYIPDSDHIPLGELVVLQTQFLADLFQEYEDQILPYLDSIASI